jgi:signal transduction histidine kinase
MQLPDGHQASASEPFGTTNEDHYVKEDRSVVTRDAGVSSGQLRRAHSKQVLSERIDIASDISARLLLQAALDALSAHVAVLDAGGTIVGVNRAWRRFGRQNGLKLRDDGIGSNYIAALPRAAGMTSLRQRFREVLRGRALGFRHSYWCPTPKGARYFEMQVQRCGRSKWRRIFVAHEDVTDLKLAEDGLRKLAGELAHSRDAERRRFARELHDTTCQDLVAASFAAERMKTLLRADDTAGREVVEELSQTLDRAMSDLRTLSYLLHTPATSAALADTVRTLAIGFAHRAGMKVRFTTNYAGRPSDGVERVILAVLQEALMNIHRHSGSKTVGVALRSTEGSLALTITDQGQWREGAEGVGLSSMRERVAEVGGSLTVRPTRRGTRLFALVPTPN